MTIFKSTFPFQPMNPIDPVYNPRRTGSRRSMSSMQWTFGTPVMVPPGKTARIKSNALQCSCSRPKTCDTKCITWEYRSTVINSSTRIDPYRQTRPKSLRTKSTSIRCSARSFVLESSSSARRRSSNVPSPRGRVPAMGRISAQPSESRTNRSGELDTMTSVSRTKNAE